MLKIYIMRVLIRPIVYMFCQQLHNRAMHKRCIQLSYYCDLLCMSINQFCPKIKYWIKLIFRVEQFLHHVDIAGIWTKAHRTEGHRTQARISVWTHCGIG